MADFARYLPLAGTVLFFGVGFVWRAWLQHRRHGDAGLILFLAGRRSHHLRDLLFVILLVLATGDAIAFAVSPALIDALGFAIGPLPASGLQLVVGSILLLGGTAFMAAAQLRLGASWRIGIDEGASPGLVTAGLYQVCRNPIFLGMFVALAGLAVLLPTQETFAALAGAVVLVHPQVLEEEAYLTSTYGDAYREYAGRVGRFLPGIGRLRREGKASA